MPRRTSSARAPMGSRRSVPSSGSRRCRRRGGHSEVPAEKADLLHAIYDRIVVAGRRIVFVQAHSVGVRPPIRACATRKGCSGAPDRCWARGARRSRAPKFVGVRLAARRPMRTGWRWPCPKRLQWRAREDSNLRPSAPEADALSTELQAREPIIPLMHGTAFCSWFECPCSATPGRLVAVRPKV